MPAKTKEKILSNKRTTEQKPNSSNSNRLYAGQSLEERKKQRRKVFLDAGLSVFGSEGYRQASVRRLCQEAQLTDRYFYQSCGNLQNLLVDVYQECMTCLSKKIIQAIVSEYALYRSPEKAILKGLEAYFSELENQKIARICMIELEGLNAEVTQVYNQYIESFAEILRQLAIHAFPDMPLSKSEQKIIALSLVGAMRQAATNWLANNYSSDRAEIVKATSKLFLGIIMLIEKK